MTLQPFSLVIPTYKEANNLPLLLKTIHSTDFAGRLFEVLLVDDNSADGSIEIVQQLQTLYPWVKMIVRSNPRSLSQSVLDGCQQASFPFIVSMDADLSHPTPAIAKMLTALETADMVIGSRYVPGGSVDKNWSWYRKFISQSSAFITKQLLGLKIQDPLSGFFAIKKSTFLQGQIINPSGWKIALEILIKCQCKQITEVPIHFSDRKYGKSKLTARVGLAFIKQLWQLAQYQHSK